MHLVKTYQPLLSIFLICFIFGSRAQEPSNFLHSSIVPPGQDDLVFRITAGGGTSPGANVIGNYPCPTDSCKSI